MEWLSTHIVANGVTESDVSIQKVLLVSDFDPLLLFGLVAQKGNRLWRVISVHPFSHIIINKRLSLVIISIAYSSAVPRYDAVKGNIQNGPHFNAVFRRMKI